MIPPLLYRRLRGFLKDKVPSLNVKLSFSTTDLPEYVFVGFQRFPVRAYVSNTWQCYNCNGYGHNAADCRFKTRCHLCGGGHNYKNCDKKDAEGRVQNTKCCNCKGDHAANYGGCPAMKSAKAIEKIRSEKKISYRDACLHYKNTKNANNIANGLSENNPTQPINSNNPENLSQTAPTADETIKSVPPVIIPQIQVTSECKRCNDRDELVKGLAIVITKLFNQRSEVKDISKKVSEAFKSILNISVAPEDLVKSVKRKNPESSSTKNTGEPSDKHSRMTECKSDQVTSHVDKPATFKKAKQKNSHSQK